MFNTFHSVFLTSLLIKFMIFKAKLFSLVSVPDHKVEYDVFVSYSTDDDEWVKEVLFRNLEKQGYAVNIHFKDFVPGKIYNYICISGFNKANKATKVCYIFGFGLSLLPL